MDSGFRTVSFDVSRHDAHKCVLPWVMAAGAPYLAWLFGDETLAQNVIGRWLERKSSEVSLNRVRLVENHSRVIGGSIVLKGAELASVRKADTLFLMIDLESDFRASVLRRVRDSRDLFGPVGQPDLYLSKIGLLPAARGMGLGIHLLTSCLSEYRSVTPCRLHLDVNEENKTAIRLYKSVGFETSARSTTADGHVSYLRMSLDLP